MDERVATLIADLERAEDLPATDLHRSARRAAWLDEFSMQQLAELLTAVGALPMPLPSAADRLLANWLAAAVHARRNRDESSAQAAPGADAVLATIEPLYRQLGPGSRARAQLLAWLATRAAAAELALLGGLLLEDPPQDDHDVVQALAPLFQRQRSQAALLFPRLLGAIRSPALAAPILDLANFLTRE